MKKENPSYAWDQLAESRALVLDLKLALLDARLQLERVSFGCCSPGTAKLAVDKINGVLYVEKGGSHE